MRETQVIILAAGLGTRLFPLSVERPKVLFPVCNVSLLARLLVQLRDAGLQRAVLSLSAVPRHVQERALAEAPSEFHLEIAVETTPLAGQIPTVRQVLTNDAEEVLVIYGDSLLNLDFGKLLRAHANARTKGGMATIVYHRPADLTVPESGGRTYHGVMAVDKEDRITRFVEKPLVTEISPGFDAANAAVFICERALLEQPDFRHAKNFSYDLFAPLVKTTSQGVYGFDIGSGFRYDLGSVSRLFDANIKILRRELSGPLPGAEETPGVWVGEGSTWSGAHITPPVFLGKGVRIGQGAQIGPDVVIGDGCQVGERAILRRVLLLENGSIADGACLDACVLGPSVRIGKEVSLPPHTVLGAFSAVGTDGWPNWVGK